MVDGHLVCDACRAIDRGDGVEDGRLYPVMAKRIGNERAFVERLKRGQDRGADAVTGFSGSLKFVYIHSLWFGLWVLANVTGVTHFDPFPFGLLTMVVSLEAIFLSTFVLVSQNRQAARADIRAEIDFENNLRGEIWAVHIGHTLGLDAEHVEDVISRTLVGYSTETGLGSAKPAGMGV